MVEQRFTEGGKDLPYDVDDWFVEQIREMPLENAFDIASQVVNNIDKLPKKNGWAQIIAGVSHTTKEPFFFAVEYLNQYDEKCVLLGVEEIDIDTFLDYINENKYLKINE